MTHNQLLGERGERCAEAYLRQNGYEILARNYRTPYGELDLIARDGETIVFIEVKTRSSLRFGSGFDAITPKKQHTLIRCAEYYVAQNNIDNALRIDAIEIILDSQQLTHLKGAVT